MSHEELVTRVTRKPGSFAPVPETALQPGGSNPTVYVVEWDIPSNSAAHRARFYRALRKLRKQHAEIASARDGENVTRVTENGQYSALSSHFSTMSVLITEDATLAGDVFNLAKAFGRAHIYEARQLE